MAERAADSDAEHDGDGRRDQGQERGGRAEDDQRGGRERVIGPSELRPDGGSDRGEHREREDDERCEAEHERAGEGAHERGDPEGDPRPSALSVQHARQHVEQGAGEARRGEEVEEERVAVGILIGRLAELLREARQLAEARIRPVLLARVLRRRRRARCDGAGRRAPDVAQAVPLREARDGARVDDTARDAALHDQIAEGAAEIGRRARGHAASQLRNHRDRHACRKIGTKATAFTSMCSTMGARRPPLTTRAQPRTAASQCRPGQRKRGAPQREDLSGRGLATKQDACSSGDCVACDARTHEREPRPPHSACGAADGPAPGDERCEDDGRCEDDRQLEQPRCARARKARELALHRLEDPRRPTRDLGRPLRRDADGDRGRPPLHVERNGKTRFQLTDHISKCLVAGDLFAGDAGDDVARFESGGCCGSAREDVLDPRSWPAEREVGHHTDHHAILRGRRLGLLHSLRDEDTAHDHDQCVDQGEPEHSLCPAAGLHVGRSPQPVDGDAPDQG